MIQGKYFSFTSASVTAGDDLIAKAEALTGNANITAKKITLISDGNITVNINSSGSSTLYEDSDHRWKLSLDDNDVLISSLLVANTSASPVWLSLVY